VRLEDIEEGERLLAEAEEYPKYAEIIALRQWLRRHAPALIAAAKAAAWRPISEAIPFDRVLVSGEQKPHGTVAGYWWWHEDDLDASGIPLGHPNATHWRPIGPLPEEG
jgi:hypothetical protein